MTTKIEQAAMVAHEANGAYCRSIGDYSQKPWKEADEWQRTSAINGVQFRAQDPGSSPRSQHEAWMSEKVADGWIYGPTKDATRKTHPCLVPYDELSNEQRTKDRLFQAVVDALLDL